MNIVIMAPRINEPQLVSFVDERTRFVLRRLACKVPLVRVGLKDLNGPKGGVDKSCRIELALPGSGKLIVGARAKVWEAAVNRALACAWRALNRRGSQGGVLQFRPMQSKGPDPEVWGLFDREA